MLTKVSKQKDLKISINKKNELVVDMTVKQMAKVFKQKNGRKPRDEQEAAMFIQNLVSRRLAEQGLVSRHSRR